MSLPRLTILMMPRVQVYAKDVQRPETFGKTNTGTTNPCREARQEREHVLKPLGFKKFSVQKPETFAKTNGGSRNGVHR
eukprot:4244855-Karenia_brevis.AAC.1